MFLSGIKDIQKLIYENTFRGLEAKVRFKDSRKINKEGILKTIQFYKKYGKHFIDSTM